MNLQDLTNRIKAKQKEFNISSEDMGLRLGLSGREAWRYKLKYFTLTIKDAAILCKLLRMKPKDFIN